MNAMEVMEISRQGLLVFFKVAMPLMLIAMIVGLVISLFQALTQIQEQTLTFVPKVVIICISLVFLMPFMLTTLTDYNNELSRRIVDIGRNDDE